MVSPGAPWSGEFEDGVFTAQPWKANHISSKIILLGKSAVYKICNIQNNKSVSRVNVTFLVLY